MKEKNPLLTPEQEAKLLTLFLEQKKLRYKIVDPVALILSSFLTPLLVAFLLEKVVRSQTFINIITDSLRTDKKMISRALVHNMARIKEQIRKFESYLKLCQTQTETDSIEKFLSAYDSLPKEVIANAIQVKRVFATAHIDFECYNPNSAYSKEFNCFDTSAEASNAKQLNDYTQKTLAQLYALVKKSIVNLKNEMKGHESGSLPELIPTRVSDFSHTDIYFVSLMLGISGITAIASKSLILEPLLVKLYNYLNNEKKCLKPISALSIFEARHLIAELTTHNSELTKKARFSTFVNMMILFGFAWKIFHDFLNNKISISAYSSNIFFIFSVVFLIEIFKIGNSYYESYRLDSKIQQQLQLLNQISKICNQNDWSITKGKSLDLSYYSLSVSKHKLTLPADVICEAIKYSLLIHDISITADGKTSIIVPADTRLNKSIVENIKNNLQESLTRLVSLRTLKAQFLNFAKIMRSDYNYYTKRDSNHSLLGVFEQVVPPGHLNRIVLDEVQQLFPKHRVKIKGDKLYIKGFEPLDDSTIIMFKELITVLKTDSTTNIMNSLASAEEKRSTESKVKRYTNAKEPETKLLLPISPAKKIQWERGLIYDPNNPRCQIYKFQSESDKNLFVVSKLTPEDFANLQSYNHYLSQIINPKRVPKRKAQGFVKAPSLCARDRYGNRFFADWKAKFLGEMGDIRALGEEKIAPTGERLIVIRAVADHKSIDRMGRA